MRVQSVRIFIVTKGKNDVNVLEATNHASFNRFPDHRAAAVLPVKFFFEAINFS